MNNYKVNLGLRDRSNEKFVSGVFAADDTTGALKQAQAKHNPFKAWKLKFSVIEKLN